nr:hypothetical protein [uncultured Agathobaculum sp.]
MRCAVEGVLAGLAALGAGLCAKERGWGPLRAAAVAAATAFAAAWALRQMDEKKTGGNTDEFL